MDNGRHEYFGADTGNPQQGLGRHRDLHMSKGVGLIPLGNRNRAIFEFGDSVLEERDSVDISTSRRR